jgi:alanine-synthesizing transaminase
VFSHRLSWDRPENALAIIEQARREAGQPIVDLTVSNPTQVGLPYPEATLRQALCDADAAAYHPTPRGLLQARVAIAADQTRRGLTVDPERLVVTASSSESYGLLFKLLCDPGDTVLVPEPSYPLFDYLARLEGILPAGYRLAYDGDWHVDFASIEAALGEARRQGHPPRALIVVNPNNPTGSFLKRAEYLRLADLCAARGLAIIADEVFADYAWGRVSLGRTAGREPVSSAAAAADASGAALTFSLGGLSKSCGLPQLKLGWIQVGGRDADVAAALARLELIADTYLSVGTPVQLAAPALLRLGAAVRASIAARVMANRDDLR